MHITYWHADQTSSTGLANMLFISYKPQKTWTQNTKRYYACAQKVSHVRIIIKSYWKPVNDFLSKKFASKEALEYHQLV